MALLTMEVTPDKQRQCLRVDYAVEQEGLEQC